VTVIGAILAGGSAVKVWIVYVKILASILWNFLTTSELELLAKFTHICLVYFSGVKSIMEECALMYI
jgi:hypothetical protein